MPKWAVERLKSPLYVTWEFTNRCLQNCKYCYNCSGPDAGPELDDQRVLDIAREIADAQAAKVFFTGGEPMCRKDLLYEAAGILRRADVYCTLMTDGTLFDHTDTSRVSELFRVVSVGLDGATAPTHDSLRGYQGGFDAAVSTIQRLTGGPVLEVSFVVTPHNHHELGAMVDLVAGLGSVQRIRATTLIESGRALEQGMSLDIDARQQFIENFVQVKMRVPEGLTCEIADPTPFLKSMMSWRPPNAMAYIFADGAVGASPWIPVIGGSVRDRPLREVWGELANFWEDGRVRTLLRNMNNVNRLGFTHRRRLDPPLMLTDLPDDEGGGLS